MGSSYPTPPSGMGATFSGSIGFGGDAVQGDKIVVAPAAKLIRPEQLPHADPNFVGRTGLLERLECLLEESRQIGVGLVVALHGMPGVGKTSLAVHWAHRLKLTFSEGHLFLNLRGYYESSPLTSGSALGQLLRTLGVDPKAVPTDEAEQEALFRSLTAGRRMVILLDNATSSDQVRPLLPGHPSCVTIVTSRRMLTGLVAHDGARPMAVELFSPAEVYALMCTTLGDRRVNRERAASADLGGRCAFLPLALSIAIAGLDMRPDKTISSVVRGLSKGNRLSRLRLDDDPHNAVRVAFERSYRDLTPALSQAFRRLCLIEGPTFTSDCASALLEVSESEAENMLGALEQEHLIEVIESRRFRIHDLIYDFGRERLTEDDDAVCQAAVRRLLLHRLATAQDRAAGLDDSADWFETERHNLQAAFHQAAAASQERVACQLAATLHKFLQLKRYVLDDITIHEKGLHVAEGLGDEYLRFRMMLNLSQAHLQLGDFDKAAQYVRRSLTLRDRDAEALRTLALVHYDLHDYEAALESASQSLEICRANGDRVGMGQTLCCMSRTYWRQGDLRSAEEMAMEALSIHRTLRDKRSEADALDLVAHIRRRLGRYAQARDYAYEALSIRKELQDRFGEAATLDNIARSLRRLGHLGSAQQHALTSLKIRTKIVDRLGEGESHDTVSRIYRVCQKSDKALEHVMSALKIRREVGDRRGEAETLENLARLLRWTGQLDQALSAAHQSLLIVEEIADHYGKASALDCLARIHIDMGDLHEALRCAEAAISVGGSLQDSFGQGRRLHNRATILLHLGEPTVALADLRKALHIQESSDDRLGELRTRESLAQAYAASGDEAGRHQAEAAAERLRSAMYIEFEISEERA
ncbi:tetratricopeptide repeat protein [Actinomadura rudentiformis]|uniref:Tetratricopeptide repeat protein n=1 Tax=Actinomadura rudentiformis TaxID=359158 RepID=A0A6H9YG74_9ACTN|nr:tetratricopeptide repeat protein [Actinomadura rudentiformis]KAB2340866.1 tetratricopeptide repeat protein [Actinomadura rudentiformis]